MSFPTTGILDDFNRANEGPPPSASWSNQIFGTETGTMAVVSNTLQKTGGAAGSCWWNVSTFGPDSEVYITATTAGAQRVYLWARLQSPGSAAADGYCLSGRGSFDFDVSRVDNTVFTNLGAAIAGNVDSGDVIGSSVVGDVISVYKNGAALDTRSDATYAGAGSIGVRYDSSDWICDDFGGGTVVAALTTPVYIQPVRIY